jgi:hypothetical protein
MNLKRWIKPRDGLPLTDPDTGVTLPEEGDEVEWTSWWQRRLNDGDVLETNEAAARKAGKAKEGDK